MQKVIAKETKHGLIKNKVYEMDNDNGKVLFKSKKKLIRLAMNLVTKDIVKEL